MSGREAEAGGTVLGGRETEPGGGAPAGGPSGGAAAAGRGSGPSRSTGRGGPDSEPSGAAPGDGPAGEAGGGGPWGGRDGGAWGGSAGEAGGGDPWGGRDGGAWGGSAGEAGGGGPRGGRVGEVDVLRGFALFGILLVNAQLMAGPYTAFGGGPAASAVDRAAAWAVTATTTAYQLFSFLLGYSFVLDRRAARSAESAAALRHLRRTAGLFGLGLAHAVLLYPGDILTTYAALGLILYALRDLTPRTAVRLAAVLVTGLAVLLLGYGLLTVALTEPLTPARYAPTVADTVAAYRGGPLSVIGAHLRELPSALGANLMYAPDMLAAFLAGLAAAGTGLLERRGRDRAWLRQTLLRWLPLGLAGGVVTACCANGPLDSRWFLVGHAVSLLTAPALTASYACAVLLLAGAVRPAAAVLAASGRMALSHYLTQSLVLACVFTGYGLGLYDRVGTAVVLAGCVLLYGAQLALGAHLMSRFRYGPAELLLRTVTLARRPGRAPACSGSPPAARARPPAR
ncbi:DUF418 domain-containing protein [Streptomyces sp. NPDC051920]|uniref:DUF418 domain-containing protein n=1 Tax=Streptomyces sp. NPDC051920 TaxID=3155523 RepID=UPI00342E7717